MLKGALRHNCSKLFLWGWVKLALCADDAPHGKDSKGALCGDSIAGSPHGAGVIGAFCFDDGKGTPHCASINRDPPPRGNGIDSNPLRVVLALKEI